MDAILAARSFHEWVTASPAAGQRKQGRLGVLGESEIELRAKLSQVRRNSARNSQMGHAPRFIHT